MNEVRCDLLFIGLATKMSYCGFIVDCLLLEYTLLMCEYKNPRSFAFGEVSSLWYLLFLPPSNPSKKRALSGLVFLFCGRNRQTVRLDFGKLDFVRFLRIALRRLFRSRFLFRCGYGFEFRDGRNFRVGGGGGCGCAGGRGRRGGGKDDFCCLVLMRE